MPEIQFRVSSFKFQVRAVKTVERKTTAPGGTWGGLTRGVGTQLPAGTIQPETRNLKLETRTAFGTFLKA
jgi:hypothetical protein